MAQVMAPGISRPIHNPLPFPAQDIDRISLPQKRKNKKSVCFVQAAGATNQVTECGAGHFQFARHIDLLQLDATALPCSENPLAQFG